MKPDLALTICGLVALMSSCAIGTAQPNPKSVAPVKPNAVIALGRIQPNGEVIKLSVVNAQDSRVDRILVKEGDFVKRAQVIAILQGIGRKQTQEAGGNTPTTDKESRVVSMESRSHSALPSGGF